MASYDGTITISGKAGEIGTQSKARGEFALPGALADTDTITWSNLLPKGGAKVIDVQVFGVEVDTNATPTLTYTVGDGTDADGYITTKTGAAGASGQHFAKGDGALVDTDVTGRDVVLTVTADPATGATSGTLFVEVTVEGN